MNQRKENLILFNKSTHRNRKNGKQSDRNTQADVKSVISSRSEVGHLTEGGGCYFRVLLEIKVGDKSLEISSYSCRGLCSDSRSAHTLHYCSLTLLNQRGYAWLVGLKLQCKSDYNIKSDLVNPQLAHNDVVHSGGDLSPHIVTPAGVELQVNGTCGGNSDKRL